MPEGAKQGGGKRKASKADGPKLPRVPLPVDGIQVNTCKTIGCENFGAEPLAEVTRGRVKAGESRKADGFRVDAHNTVKGWKRLRCTKCGGHTTFKSNAAIKEEFDRIARPFARQASPACQNPECSNCGLDVASHPRLYHAHGKTKSGSPRWRCKACRRPVTLKKVGRTEHTTHENLNIFRLLVLKNPIRSIIKFTQLNPKVVYDKIDIIHRQCVAFAADRERDLLEMEFPSLFISCDRQDYMVNWSNSEDKRVTQLTAIASADNISGYVFGHHVNFDPDHEQVDIRRAARECGDFKIVEPAFRRFARLWLEEEMKQAAKRDPGLDFPPPPEEGGVEHLIEARSAEMAAVPDPEALERVFESSRTPKTGMQVHFEYTVHAHFRLLARLLVGPRKLRFYTDHHPRRLRPGRSRYGVVAGQALQPGQPARDRPLLHAGAAPDQPAGTADLDAEQRRQGLARIRYVFHRAFRCGRRRFPCGWISTGPTRTSTLAASTSHRSPALSKALWANSCRWLASSAL